MKEQPRFIPALHAGVAGKGKPNRTEPNREEEEVEVEEEEESFEFETDGRKLDEFSSLERRIRSWNQNGKNTRSREGP